MALEIDYQGKNVAVVGGTSGINQGVALGFADLGAKVARRYSDRFLEALGEPQSTSGDSEVVLQKIHKAFADSLGRDGKMCLCGVLAAESAGLPEAVALEAKRFFDGSLSWLTESLFCQL